LGPALPGCRWCDGSTTIIDGAITADLSQLLNPKRLKSSAIQNGLPFMNLDDYLSKATIVGCNGQTAYEMTFLLNGDVLVSGRVGNC
jgi:hypothetical protein